MTTNKSSFISFLNVFEDFFVTKGVRVSLKSYCDLQKSFQKSGLNNTYDDRKAVARWVRQSKNALQVRTVESRYLRLMGIQLRELTEKCVKTREEEERIHKAAMNSARNDRRTSWDDEPLRATSAKKKKKNR